MIGRGQKSEENGIVECNKETLTSICLNGDAKSIAIVDCLLREVWRYSAKMDILNTRHWSAELASLLKLSDRQEEPEKRQSAKSIRHARSWSWLKCC